MCTSVQCSNSHGGGVRKMLSPEGWRHNFAWSLCAHSHYKNLKFSYDISRVKKKKNQTDDIRWACSAHGWKEKYKFLIGKEGKRSPNSSVGIVVVWTDVEIFPVDANLSLLHSVQPAPGVQAASQPMSTGDDFPGVKRPGHEADPRSRTVKLYLHFSICLHGIMPN
jgi:hypothetical protein